MTTYQDIVDYLNDSDNPYFRYKLSTKEDGSHAIANTKGDSKIVVYEDAYYYYTPFNISSKLSHLLTDLLDTPVDKRFKPKIKHSVDPVNSSDKLIPNLLTTADQVIQDINSFIVRTKHGNPKVIMFINTDLGKTKLNEIFKLYKDYNIIIYNHRDLSPEYDLLIEPKKE